MTEQILGVITKKKLLKTKSTRNCGDPWSVTSWGDTVHRKRLFAQR